MNKRQDRQIKWTQYEACHMLDSPPSKGTPSWPLPGDLASEAEEWHFFNMASLLTLALTTLLALEMSDTQVVLAGNRSYDQDQGKSENSPLYCPSALSLRVSLISAQSLCGTSQPPEDEKRSLVLSIFFFSKTKLSNFWAINTGMPLVGRGTEAL